MRFIGLDIHRDFCEVAAVDGGGLHSLGRVATTPAELTRFGEGLSVEDEVVVEATGNAAAVVRLLAPYVGRTVVANPRRLSGVVGPRAKTDRLDARALARLLAAGMIEEVWTPTDELRALRRLLARRAALVRARTRAKNEVHAALLRNLHPRPPVKDLFGRAGRRWLAGLAFPADEQVTVEGCLRQVDALDEEIERLERLLAEQAIRSTEIRRLLTVPGVNLITAATFVAWVGDVRRFPSSRKLVGYLGLDPRVRQSGNEPARHGRISKQGASDVRHVLGEAVWSVVLTPGPMRAFFERVRARRGPQVAATATARKLSVLFWHMLIRGEDYAFQRPSLTRHKIRQLELRAGAPRRHGKPAPDGISHKNPAQRAAERLLSEQAEHSYQRLISDWQRKRPKGADAATGERR